MKLSTVELSALHFPRSEWRWLRPAVGAPTLEDSPDAFLWGARVGVDGALWAWHPRGSDVLVSNPQQKVRVLEIETDGTELEAHALFLKTSFEAQAAHDVEWVAALHVLSSRFGYKLEERGLPRHWKPALAACGLEGHLGVLAQRKRYLFLTEDEMRLVFERRWDLNALELLETTPAAIRTAFVASIRKWQLTAGQTREALSAALMLSKKMGEKSSLSVLAGSFANAEEFRTALFRTSQPELATLSQRRLELLRGLNLPPRSSVFGDPSFESDLLKITHTPRKIADFELFRHWIAHPETQEKIRTLLEIYQ